MDATTNKYTTGLMSGSTRQDNQALGTLSRIWRSEGLAGLYRGWQPTIIRAALVTVGLTVGYDQTKECCKEAQLLDEGFALHAVASVASGISASVLSAPFDIVKSRVMANPQAYRLVSVQFLALLIVTV